MFVFFFFQHRSFSKFNLNSETFLGNQKTLRPRQNSVIVGSSIMTLPANTPRKVRSAFDLQNLVFSDPAVSKSAVKINFNGGHLRRQSLLAVCSRKSTCEPWQNESIQQVKERRLSFKDLFDVEKSRKYERVHCYLEKESAENEPFRRNRRMGEVKQRSAVSNQSSLTDSRNNSITNQDLKSGVGTGNKFSCSEKKNSSLIPPQKISCSNLRELEVYESRSEMKSVSSNRRRNSAFLPGTLDNDKQFLNPREGIKSGVIDFRRNSMLIINNLTEDIGCRLYNGDFTLGGSNVTLGTDYFGRRNSVMPSCGDDGKQRLSIIHATNVKSKPYAASKHNVLHFAEVKCTNRKPSKSLDCGDSIRIPVWRNKKEVNQSFFASERKKLPRCPSLAVDQNFLGSSTSLNAFSARKEGKSIEESRSTGNINLEFDRSQINEAKYFRAENFRSKNHKENSQTFSGNKTSSPEKELEFKLVPKVNITTSLMNLDLTSGTSVNIVTSNADDDIKIENSNNMSHV